MIGIVNRAVATRRAAYLVVLVAIVALSMTLVAVTSAGSSHARVRGAAPSHARLFRWYTRRSSGASHSVEVRGGTPLRASVDRVVTSLGSPNQVTSITLSNPPADYGAPSRSDWLDLKVAIRDRPGAIYGAWQAFLVAGAITANAHAQGLPPIAGKTVQFVLPDCSIIDGGSSINPTDATPPGA